MATTRTLLDDKGKNILELLVDNMETIGDINMSVAASNQIGSYDGSWGEVNINYPRLQQANKWRQRVESGSEYFVREISFPAKVGEAFGKNEFFMFIHCHIQSPFTSFCIKFVNYFRRIFWNICFI